MSVSVCDVIICSAGGTHHNHHHRMSELCADIKHTNGV